MMTRNQRKAPKRPHTNQDYYRIGRIYWNRRRILSDQKSKEDYYFRQLDQDPRRDNDGGFTYGRLYPLIDDEY